MGMFVAGMVAGVLCIFGYVVYHSTRPQRLGPLLIQSFQVSRLHLGRNTLIAGLTGPHGWRIEVNCFGCKRASPIAPDSTEFRCDHCKRLFRDTGNEEGGAGVNVIDVSTHK
jgi:hypothetical protein